MRSATTATSEGETSSSISEGTATPLPFDRRGAAPHSGVGEELRSSPGIGVTWARLGVMATATASSNAWEDVSISRVWIGGGVEKTFGVAGMLLSV